MDAPDAAVETFEAHRGTLTGIAYRMLGSIDEAEDVVQDAWLRWDRIDHGEVASPRAYLTQIVTRLSLDRMRRLKARREQYVGTWLPEPRLASPDVAEDAELAESVSLATLVVLESLSPLERAAFVLREVFGLPHAEVAAALGRSEAAVRQLARRARDNVDARRPRLQLDSDTRRRVTERLMRAWIDGDMDTLMRLLGDEAALLGDGGGKVRAPLKPIVGAVRIARFVASSRNRFPTRFELEPVEVNGGPGVAVTVDGTVVTLIVLDLDARDDRVRTIYTIGNPDKLAHLDAALAARR